MWPLILLWTFINILQLDQVELKDYELAELGDQLVALQDHKKALEFYNIALNGNPSEVSYYRRRGNCFTDMGNFVKAYEDFSKVILTAKQYSEEGTLLLDDIELARLGKGLFTIWKFEEAAWCYSEAIKRNPSNLSYYSMRGLCYMKTRDLNGAISDFKHVVQINPQSTDDQLSLRQALLDSGRYNEAVTATLSFSDVDLVKLGEELRYSKKSLDEALRCYTAAIEKSSKNAQHYLKRGYCHLEMKNSEKAVADFEMTVKLDPQNTNYWFVFLSNSGKYEAAVAKATKVLNDNQLAMLGKRFFDVSRYQDALRLFTEAIGKKSTVASYYRLRGDCLLKMKKSDEAILDLRKGMDLDKGNESDRIHLSETLFDLGRYKEAIDEMAVVNDTQLALLGIKFLYYSKVREALRCFTEAINKNDKNAVYYENRGLCNWKLGRLNKAIEDFQKAIEIGPPTLKVQIDLSEALVQAGKYDEAQQILGKIDQNYQYKRLSMSEAARIKFVREKMERREQNTATL